MGCGSSTPHKPEAATATSRPEKQPEKVESTNNNAGALNPEGTRKANKESDKPNVVKEPSKVEEQPQSAAPVAGTQSKVVETVEPEQDLEAALPSREKTWTGTKLNAANGIVTICYAHLTSKSGLTFASFNTKTGDVLQAAFTDEETTTLKDETSKDLDWPGFWKTLNKGNVSLKGDEGILEYKMRQSREPKDIVMRIKMEKADESVLPKHFIFNYAKIRLARTDPKDKDKEKDKV